MRLAPVPLFFAGDPEKAIEMSGWSSLTTHGNVLCIDACRYLGALIVGAVSGASKEELLSELYCPVPGDFYRNQLHQDIHKIAIGSFKTKNPPAIKGSGFVVASLEAALWAFYNSSSFEEGCLKAVNLGDDADTTGAVYGQLAGAYYGVAAIPAHWRDQLAHHDLLIAFADQLHDLAQ